MIEIREARPHEVDQGCNTCEDSEQRPVEIVVEMGRQNSGNLTRLCGRCFIGLKHTVDDVAGWDVYRDEW